MSPNQRVATKVRKLLPVDLDRVKQELVTPGYGCVINGIMIEGTSTKDRLQVRRFQYAFFRKRETLAFNLSDVIYNVADGRDNFYFSGTVEKMAAHIAESLIKSGLAQQLQHPYTLRNFLDEHCPNKLPEHYNDFSIFDFCCATFLSGDVQAARAGMLHMREEWDRAALANPGPHHPVIERRHREIIALADLVPSSDATIRAYILARVAENAALLGFSPTGL